MVRRWSIVVVVLFCSWLPLGAQGGSGDRQPSGAAKSAPSVVNLNSASVAELESLPGIGPKVAARIVEYRSQKGPFKKVEELMNVQGVGEKNFLKLRQRVTVTDRADVPARR